MHSHKLKEVTFANKNIMEGKILYIKSTGEIVVESDNGLEVSCYFLRTSAGAPPKFAPGASVLFVMDERYCLGYVLGIVEKYLPEQHKLQDDALSLFQRENDKEIILDASERVEFRCGKSSLLMNKEGKVVLKGSDIVSRASRNNKIKGSSVRIN